MLRRDSEAYECADEPLETEELDVSEESICAGTPNFPTSGSEKDASVCWSDWLMACHDAGSSSGGKWRHRSSGSMSLHDVEGIDLAIVRAPGVWVAPPSSGPLSDLIKFLRRALTNQ